MDTEPWDGILLVSSPCYPYYSWCPRLVRVEGNSWAAMGSMRRHDVTALRANGSIFTRIGGSVARSHYRPVRVNKAVIGAGENPQRGTHHFKKLCLKGIVLSRRTVWNCSKNYARIPDWEYANRFFRHRVWCTRKNFLSTSNASTPPKIPNCFTWCDCCSATYPPHCVR